MPSMSAESDAQENRRPLKTRDKGWAKALAKWLADAGVSPNAISLCSIVFAAGSMACFLIAPDMAHPVLIALAWLGAAAGIQLRLLCNLLDGMVAVEGGKRSLLGGLFNEVPDRIADVLILVGAGYSTQVEPEVIKLFGVLPLGWSCAVVALWTAYIRSIGAELTGKHFFHGPMAKQHRMFVLTVGCGMAFVADLMEKGGSHTVLLVALAIIFFGGLVTCWRRLRLVAKELASRKCIP